MLVSTFISRVLKASGPNPIGAIRTTDVVLHPMVLSGKGLF
jgi:hypothetical protein